MADNLFAETVVTVGGKRTYTVLLSMVAHTLVIAAAIMIPLLAADAIVPARLAVIAYYIAPPSPPRLPSHTAPAKESLPGATPSIPLVAPEGIAAEPPSPPTDDPSAAVLDNAGIVRGGEVPGLLPSPPPVPIPEQAPVRLSSEIRRPTKVRDAVPIYPAIARAARVEGVVIIEATIDPNGRVQDARILRSIPLLDAAALDAVRQWEYTPTLLNGVPIAVVMTVTVDFRLR